MPNRLAHAASPYLRSHADNPVDWWAWGPEPFADAARRDVPVLVSIGYSTCHWCHVMARESFSDPTLAAFLNEHFVAIKVDREEHAEVDSTYLAAAGAFTENLGWPLNVFVTPTGRAFFAGTYWPPAPVQGHPAFRQILDAVLDAWLDRREEVERNGEAILEALSHRHSSPSVAINFAAIVAELEQFEDTVHGGFGGAPKFPVTPVLQFLLARASLGDAVAHGLAERTLDAMAASPLLDLDGGFFRYATRRDWSEPHYERMLYDNAQLLAVYALAGRREIAAGIADFMLGTLRLPNGCFASAQDSESTVGGERVEGEYYLLDASARKAEIPPALDEKVLTGWNGLAIGALARAGTFLERPDWIAAAKRAANVLLAEHRRDEPTSSGGSVLVRASINGVQSTAKATLEDYGMLAGGLLELATATGEVEHALWARELIDASLAAAEGSGELFGVPGGADPVLQSQGLAVAPDTSDGAYPSGLSAMASAAHRLWLLTGHAAYRAAAAAGVESVSAAAVQHPVSLGAALAVATALDAPALQLVVVTDPETDAAAAAVGRRHRPDAAAAVARTWHRAGAVAIVVTSAQAEAFAASGFELFEARTTDLGVATAYLCEEFVCRLPLTSAAALAQLLK